MLYLPHNQIETKEGKKQTKEKGKGQTTPGRNEGITEILSEYKSKVYRWKSDCPTRKAFLVRTFISCMPRHIFPSTLTGSAVPAPPTPCAGPPPTFSGAGRPENAQLYPFVVVLFVLHLRSQNAAGLVCARAHPLSFRPPKTFWLC